MDFDFSEDQQQLREAVRRFVERGYGFERRRQIVASGGFDAGVWSELAQLGLTGLLVSDQHGGLGLGPVDAMVAQEELGRGLVLEPLTQALIAAATLERYADGDLQANWLPRIASGEALMALAQQERRNRYDLRQCAAQAQRAAGLWALSGAKHLVAAGDLAQAFLVPAMVDGNVALFLVEREGGGVSVNGYSTQDGSRAADLRFDQAPAQMVGTPGSAALEYAVDVGIASLSAQAVGAMEKTLALTVEYMNTRKQFGLTLASFQALRHRVADMKMQLELARAMSYYASLKLGAPDAERRQALSRVKVQLGASMRFVGQQAVQLHGGIGVTDEYSVSHYFKALTQMEMCFGDSLHHLGEVSARMGDTAGVFA